ncbi:anti-sigma factor [Pseudomonas sp. TH05]|uniref:anti-sigma factor n=1 Tax=unclassified Pseudomonas TaxID=196821 RepID=UPI000996DF31|nr:MULTISPECIES: anti-sigma factor [unclassified Pseudomonas]MBK5537608.1 anti-sigma factor [Pseudomonas sp. TH07]MBK5555575.1 anti-sigma factor [Pseudomonas sp. TH05]OOV91716.1 anti-sigma factor [Pseudomonas sp. MF4836]
MNYQTPALRRALAADYSIGLMQGAARRRFEQWLLDDAALRAEVAQWQEHLASLTHTLPEQDVPERVWQAIQARIEPQRLHVPPKQPLWMRLRLVVAACAVLASLYIGFIYQSDSVRYSATLLSASQQPALQIQAHGQYLQVDPLALATVGLDRSLELWAIPADGKPISLGVVPVGGKGRINLSQAQRDLLGTPIALAVSLEPHGGSPTGQPTGPVLYQGPLVAL